VAYYGDEIKGNMMDGECSTNGREMRITYKIFVGGNRRQEALGIERRIILKWISTV
jgi:hypothetical protein